MKLGHGLTSKTSQPIYHLQSPETEGAQQMEGKHHKETERRVNHR
jgi:hypothetical protein